MYPKTNNFLVYSCRMGRSQIDLYLSHDTYRLLLAPTQESQEVVRLFSSRRHRR